MTGPIELKTIELFGTRRGPHLLITGGVHGDEFEPMAAIRKLNRCLQSQDAVMSAGLLTLVPVVNEAAFLRGTRAAEDGLDLARVCPGDETGSVTERTAFALSNLIREADYYIDLHTGGIEFSVLPLVGYTLHSDPEILDKQRAMARAFNLPVIWGTAPTLHGRSLSVARDAGVPAIYAEYLGGGRCESHGVDAYHAGCLNVMSQLGMIDHRQPDSRVERVIEDSRPDSGHMQVCNPSPATGFFEPAVELGQEVQSGELLGTVTEPLGHLVRDVHAKKSGIVLVLRTLSRVREGESVGVVVETSV